MQTKNLFLRDKRGRRHLLLVTTCEKSVDIKRFAETADADHLSFASPERMMRYLGVEPGSVTVFGLVLEQTGHTPRVVTVETRPLGPLTGL